jgi:hypothetical protein
MTIFRLTLTLRESIQIDCQIEGEVEVYRSGNFCRTNEMSWFKIRSSGSEERSIELVFIDCETSFLYLFPRKVQTLRCRIEWSDE